MTAPTAAEAKPSRRALHVHLEQEDHDAFEDLCARNGTDKSAAVQTFTQWAELMPEEFWADAKKVAAARRRRSQP